MENHNQTVIRFGDEEYRELVLYMIRKFGIDLSKKRILAECRLDAELRRWNQSSLRGYLKLLRADKSGRMERELLNRLTTNYTYFCREKKHFEYLEKEILPSVLSDPGSPPYQIWCAGCSSGEECYTLAMVLAEYRRKGGKLPPCRITGTDISERSLKKAEEARYPMRETERLPETWRDRYCVPEPEGDYFKIRPELCGDIRFVRKNLLDSVFEAEQYDLVFCRNVMIYFDEDARRRLLSNLHYALRPGGYLFLGHTELLPRNHDLFHYICPAIYRK